MEFTSRSDDKTQRWMITDRSSEPTLISRPKEKKEKEEEKEGEGETEEGKEDNVNSNEEKGEIEGTRQQVHGTVTPAISFL